MQQLFNQIQEEKNDALDVTLTQPDNPPNNNQTPKGSPPQQQQNKNQNDNHVDSKELDNDNNNNDNNLPQRQSMSPPRKSSNNPFDQEDKNSLINNNAVLIIPLDNRVTPQMVSNKFNKYGKILQVRPIKKSSTCIVIFSKASEAQNCIRLFANHDKVRVTRPEQLQHIISTKNIFLPSYPCTEPQHKTYT